MEGNPVAERTPWYRAHRFPLLPRFWSRTPDRWNHRDWHVTWLCFAWWTLMSPALGFEFEIDDRDLTVRIRLPYNQFVVKVPLFPGSWSQKTWRVSSRWREVKMAYGASRNFAVGQTVTLGPEPARVMAVWDEGISIHRPWWWLVARLFRVAV